MDPSDIIKFWFEEIDEKMWWQKDNKLDLQIAERFGFILNEARQSALFKWRKTSLGRLAEIIVLDQFSRNIFRDQPEAFAQDPLALALSQEAVARGCLKDLTEEQKLFLIMPFMHSESLEVHDEALKLFRDLGREANLEFEIKHREIIVQFGRYPHRNEVLNRPSTPEEKEFLKKPGSSF